MKPDDIVTLIFSGIVAISTVFYVLLTWKLAKETRLSREFFLESNIVAYLETTEAQIGHVRLIIKNIGKGLARNVKFMVTKDLDYENAISLSSIDIFNDGINFFPPEVEYKYILMCISDSKEKQNDNIIFKISYSDDIIKNREQWFTLNIREIKDQGKLTPPDTHIGMIAYRLGKIEKLLETSFKSRNVEP
ncbi:MAG TPA: hypothetical protein DDX98_13045 [Bacteroidales bacterium]|jgi:hypothetical protein|nr:hypothetical protein [Bacteroidales bacterium]